MFDGSLFTIRPLPERLVNSFLSKNSNNSIEMFRLIFVSFLNKLKSTKPLLFSEAIFSTILAHFKIGLRGRVPEIS